MKSFLVTAMVAGSGLIVIYMLGSPSNATRSEVAVNAIRSDLPCKSFISEKFDNYASRTKKKFTAEQREFLIQLRVEGCMRNGFGKQ